MTISGMENDHRDLCKIKLWFLAAITEHEYYKNNAKKFGIRNVLFSLFDVYVLVCMCLAA